MSNISRSKGIQTMKFGRLIEYNIWNIFLEKSYPKCGRETKPIPLKYIKTMVLTTSFYLIRRFFKKQKGLELVFQAHFLHEFSKIFLPLYFINQPNFIAWVPLLLEILDNKCIVIICCPGCDAIKFWTNLNFFIKPFFYITKKLGGM